MLLDQNVEELFLPYLQGLGYMEKVKEILEKLYSGLLLKFSLFHEQRKARQNLGVLDRFKRMRERAIEKILESDIGKSQSAALSRIIGLNRKTGEVRDSDHLSDVIPVVSDTDGQLNVEHAKRMLMWLGEAVGRSLELSSSVDTPKDVLSLINLLMEYMRTTYLDVALDAAFNAIEQSTKTEPDISPLTELKSATRIINLMFAFINTAHIPLSQTAFTIRRDMVKLSNNALAGLERKCNTFIHKSVDVIITYLSALLSKQKKQDFRPRDGELSLTTLQTPTCLAVCAFLRKRYEVARESLDGANLEALLT